MVVRTAETARLIELHRAGGGEWHDLAMEFDCPRCGTAGELELYGPCDTCRSELRARYAGEARPDVVADAYEPKMNVTPNNVAAARGDD